MADNAADNTANAVFTALKAVTNFGMMDMIVPTAVISFPTIISTGPTAAKTSPMVTIVFFVPSSKEFNQFTKDCTHSIIVLTQGSSNSPREIASDSTADFKIVS